MNYLFIQMVEDARPLLIVDNNKLRITQEDINKIKKKSLDGIIYY